MLREPTVSDSAQDANAGGGQARGFTWDLVNLAIGAGLALAAFIVYLLPALMGRPLMDRAEARVAVAAREMIQSGNYVLPNIEREAATRKPPLPGWLAALSGALITAGNPDDTASMARAAMLPPAASAALAIVLLVFFGSRLFDRRAGIMSGLILGASLLAVRFAQSGHGDATFMLACAGTVCGMAFLLSDKPGLGGALLAGFSLGLAILTRGAIPLMLIVLPLAAEAIWRRKNVGWFNIGYIAMAFVIALLVATPWFVLAERQQKGVIDGMAMDTMNSITSVMLGTQPDLPVAPEIPLAPENARYGFLHDIAKAAAGFLPWTPLLILGLFVWVLTTQYMERADEQRRGASRFFALYAAFGFLCFLAIPRRQEQFLLPLLPALALTVAAQCSRLNAPGNAREERMGWSQLAVGVVVALLLCCAPFVGTAVKALGISAQNPAAACLAGWSSISWLGPVLGFLVLALSVLCARMWAGGNAPGAVGILAGVLLVAIVVAAVRPGQRERYAAVWSNAEKLKKETDALPADTRLYAAGPGDAQMAFYTGRTVQPLRELAGKPAGSGRAVLIVRAETTTLYGVQLGSAKRDVSDDYALIDLSAQLETDLRAAIHTPGER